MSSPGTCGVYESVGPVATDGVVVRRDVHRVGTRGLGDRAIGDAVVERRPAGRFSVELMPAPDREIVADPAADLGRISTRMRARFSTDPPYSSVRSFFAGDRKPSMR